MRVYGVKKNSPQPTRRKKKGLRRPVSQGEEIAKSEGSGRVGKMIAQKNRDGESESEWVICKSESDIEIERRKVIKICPPNVPTKVDHKEILVSSWVRRNWRSGDGLAEPVHHRKERSQWRKEKCKEQREEITQVNFLADLAITTVSPFS